MRVTYIVSLALLLVPGLAVAQGGYGALSYFDWEIESPSSTLSAGTVRAAGGYMFADYGVLDLGVEAQVASGGSDDLQLPTGPATTEDAEAELNKLVAVFARPNLSLLDGLFNIYGLAGYSYGRVDILAETTATTITESGFSWGGGAEVALIRDRLYLAADYVSYISGGDVDASAVSLGLRLSFSQ